MGSVTEAGPDAVAAPRTRRRRPGLAGVGRWIVGGLGLLAAAAGVAGLLARHSTSPAHVIVILAAGVPLLTLLNLASLAVLMAAVRSRLVLLAALLVTVGLLATQVPGLTADAPRLGAGVQLRLFTANLRLGQADAPALVASLRAQHADVVALQELTGSAADRLDDAGINRDYPYSIVDAANGAAGVGLWSRLPLTSRLDYYRGFNFHLVSAVLTPAPVRSMTVFSSHVAAPWPQNPAGWVSDLQHLGPVLRATHGPLVDAGDFNATTDHARFRQLLSTAGTVDASQQSGSAPAPTYPADRPMLPPLLTIDHVLVRTVEAASVHSVTVRGSDHRGLLAVLGFPAG